MSKRRLWLAGVPVICALAVARCGQESWDKEEHAKQARPQGATEETTGTSTKASARSKRAASSHSPERLKQFFLQPVPTQGLTLAAALEKLKAAYKEACVETGETALDLEFQVPAGKNKPLRVNLGVSTVETSIQRLAMFSGMRVKREGPKYVFEAPQETGEPRKKSVKVSSLTPHDLNRACHVITPDGSRDFALDLRTMGLDLDPSTRVMHFPAAPSKLPDAGDGSGLVLLTVDEFRLVDKGTELIIEGTSAADELAVSAFLAALQEPLLVPQHKIKAKVIELAAGSDWTMPDLSQSTEQEIQLMVRELTERQGAKLIAVPEALAQEGEQAKVDVIDQEWTPLEGMEGEFMTLSRELVVGEEGEDDKVERYKLGMVMEFTSRVLGFGHRTTFHFTDTLAPEDWAPDQPAVEKRVDLKDTAWARKGNSFLRMQGHPDGSRTLIVVTGETEMVPFKGFRAGL